MTQPNKLFETIEFTLNQLEEAQGSGEPHAELGVPEFTMVHEASAAVKELRELYARLANPSAIDRLLASCEVVTFSAIRTPQPEPQSQVIPAIWVGHAQKTFDGVTHCMDARAKTFQECQAALLKMFDDLVEHGSICRWRSGWDCDRE